MGLDFTKIPDKAGAALYILHSGLSRDVERFSRLASDITKASHHQVVVLEARTPDAEKIIDFYDINSSQLPIALIIKDDDTVNQQWESSEIPSNPTDFIYLLDRIG